MKFVVIADRVVEKKNRNAVFKAGLRIKSDSMNLELDSDYMRRSREGDVKAFELLVKRHQSRVFHLAYRFLGNAALAQDAAQDVFVNVYAARHTYVPSAKFTTWLYIIVKNTCLKIIARMRPTVSLDEPVHQGDTEMPRQLADTHMHSPAEQCLDGEIATQVRSAVAALPEQQRLAVVLARFEGLSYEEIAQVLGSTPKAVKSLLHRAREALKIRLEKYVQL